MKRLTANDLEDITLIASIHESLPKLWLESYSSDPDEIEKTIVKLTEKLKTDDVFCVVIKNSQKCSCLAFESASQHGGRSENPAVSSEICSFIWAEVNEANREIIDIMSLWTHEDYRGQGLALQLKSELEEWARLHTKAKMINTTVSVKNNAMGRLNQRLGYETAYYKMTKKL